MDWKTMLSYISGSVDEELLLRNEYLVAENRVLRNQLQGRLRLTDGERRSLSLAEIGKRLGKQALDEIASIVNPDTILGWLSIIIIGPGLDSRARTALEHMLESVVSARGKVLRTNFSATSRVTRATKLTQAASRHSYRWCSPPTRGSATTFAVGDGRCVTALKLGVSLFSTKWQRSS